MMKHKVLLKRMIILLFIFITTIFIYQKFIKKDFVMTRLGLEDNLTYFHRFAHMDYKEGSLLKFHNERCNKVNVDNDEYDFLLEESCIRVFVIQNLKELYTSNSNLFKFMEIYEKECNEGVDISCRAFSTLVYFTNDDKLQKYIQQRRRNFKRTSDIHLVPEYQFSYRPADAMPSVISSCIKDKLELLGYEFTSNQKCSDDNYRATIFPLVKEDIYSELSDE